MFRMIFNRLVYGIALSCVPVPMDDPCHPCRQDVLR
jgi:hypothetical protein